MKIYCINLDRRPDRRDHMWSQFEKLAIEVERVPAVDGSLPEVAAKISGLPPGVSGFHLGAGAYACLQSHRLVWQKLLDSGAPYAMVLEDDLVISDEFVNFLDDGWVPAEANLVRLETRAIRVHLDRQSLSLGHGRYLGRLRSTHYGSACYVVSSATAANLLRLTETVVDAVDEIMFDSRHEICRKLSIYQMVPAPAIPGDKYLDKKDRDTWARTSIERRFGPGEGARPEQRSFLKRIDRRIREEFRAVRSGSRYTFIPFG